MRISKRGRGIGHRYTSGRWMFAHNDYQIFTAREPSMITKVKLHQLISLTESKKAVEALAWVTNLLIVHSVDILNANITYCISTS